MTLIFTARSAVRQGSQIPLRGIAPLIRLPENRAHADVDIKTSGIHSLVSFLYRFNPAQSSSGRCSVIRISEKTVHLIGGALFLLFGLHALVFGE